MIDVQGLSKQFGGRVALADLTFSVRRGQVMGLVGPEGGGKTTTLRVLAGCLVPSAGSARVAGHDVAERPREARRRTGYLPSPAALDDELRVEPYLATMCRLRGVPPRIRRDLVEEALAACGLGDRQRDVIGLLPPAQRRRVGLAQAVVHGPDVLLLDDPLEGLDGDEVAELLGVIAGLVRTRTAVVATRLSADLDGICQGVVILAGGRQVEAGAEEAMERRPDRQVVAVVGGDAEAVERHVRALAGVAEVRVTSAGEGDHRLVVTGVGDDLQDEVARVVVERGLRLRELSAREAGE